MAPDWLAGTPRFWLAGNLIEIIGPPLHHCTPFRQILGVIVGSTDGVGFGVSKLALNDIGVKAVLIQDSAGRAAKAVFGGT